MIKSFKDKDAEELFRDRKASKRLAPYAKAALRKLDQIDVVDRVDELAIPPSNRLKKINSSDNSTWQIYINDQYRVRFRWESGHAYDVEVGNFH